MSAILFRPLCAEQELSFEEPFRDHSGYGLSQWEEALLSNAFSHWPSTYPEWSLPSPDLTKSRLILNNFLWSVKSQSKENWQNSHLNFKKLRLILCLLMACTDMTSGTTLTHSGLVTYMHQWTGSSKVQLMACHPFGTFTCTNNGGGGGGVGVGWVGVVVVVVGGLVVVVGGGGVWGGGGVGVGGTDGVVVVVVVVVVGVKIWIPWALLRPLGDTRGKWLSPCRSRAKVI